MSELSTNIVGFVSEAWANSLEKIRHTLATVTDFPEYTEGNPGIAARMGVGRARIGRDCCGWLLPKREKKI